MSSDEIMIEGFVTFVEPGDLKAVRPKISAFAIVGILNTQLWFSGTMPGVERGCRIRIRGKLDGWIIRVGDYNFIDPTPIQQCVMDTLAVGGRIHYLNENSIFTNRPAPAIFSKSDKSAAFRLLAKVSKSEKVAK
jgi:hypothetical protein